MGGGSIYNKENIELLNLPQEQKQYNPYLNLQQYNSLYPTYDPNEYQIHPITLNDLPPELPPVPEAYRQPRNNDQDIVRLIYTKSGFYLKEPNMHGFFTIFSKSMENMNVHIAWIPEYLIEPADIDRFIQLDGHLASDDDYPDIYINLEGETMVIMLKDIDTIYAPPPSEEEQGSMVITLNTGEMLKPIYYSSQDHWPGYDIIDILSAFILIKRAEDMDYLYLVSFSTEDDLEYQPHVSTRATSVRSASSVNTARLSEQPKRSASEIVFSERQSVRGLGPSNENAVPKLPPRSNSPEISSRHQREKSESSTPLVATASAATDPFDPFISTIRDAQWTILERLSRITQYSRDTASQVLEHPMARPVLPLLPPSLQQLLKKDNMLDDYETASQYLAQYGQATAEDEHFLDDHELQNLLADIPELQGPSPIHTRRRGPIAAEEWVSLFDQEGKLSIPIPQVKQMIFQGGLDNEVRAEAWKFLLGIYPWHSTFEERDAIRQSQTEAYYRIKAVWFNDISVQESNEFQDEKHRIDKDVHRTDRNHEAFANEDMPNPDPQMVVGTNSNMETMKDILVTYNFYNTELGYVQGMSDLLAPLFVIMNDEAMSFWAFTRFMDRVQSNFYMDQSGMHAQLKTLNLLVQFMDPVLHKRFEEIDISNLFFCFRWLLVWFKREFDWEDIIRLWENLWTDHLAKKMILFIALAVIDTHREKILNELNQFDEVLRYINDLTGNIDLNHTLERAEVLYYQFERKIRAMQRKTNLLKDKLEERTVWNSPERYKIQEDIEKLKIPDHLLELITL
ncbi:hypothetical protein RMATCC62417_09764 [Rhizopus microsporus]|nr:hypothetical protein RMATCC62417_09764 [Rhizopus microsporus]